MKMVEKKSTMVWADWLPGRGQQETVPDWAKAKPEQPLAIVAVPLTNVIHTMHTNTYK